MGIGQIFREQVDKGLGGAVIMMGSGSDDKAPGVEPGKKPKLSHIEKIAESLEVYGIPYEARVLSAHKQPLELIRELKEYDTLTGPFVMVAVAGKTDALSGILSFLHYPIVSCPPDASNDSCSQNPPGSSNATILQPKNVGKFIAQIYAHLNPSYREQLRSANEAKISELVKQDNKIRGKYEERQRGKK